MPLFDKIEHPFSVPNSKNQYHYTDQVHRSVPQYWSTLREMTCDFGHMVVKSKL